MTNRERKLLHGLAITVNDLYPWADRNKEDLEGKEIQQHSELMGRAKRLLHAFDEMNDCERCHKFPGMVILNGIVMLCWGRRTGND